MTGYILDSDLAIELLRGRSLHLTKKLSSTPGEEVFLSTVTVSELLFGAYRSRNPIHSFTLCHRFCSSYQILPLDETAAERAANVRADLETLGKRIGAYDVLIAGIALAYEHVLVTHNTREFGRIQGLQLEDWTQVE